MFDFSGLFLCYVSYGEIKKRSVNFFLILIRRWVRFTPTVVLNILISYLVPLLGTGPVFGETVPVLVSEPCKHYWWKTILFINNFFPMSQQVIH